MIKPNIILSVTLFKYLGFILEKTLISSLNFVDMIFNEVCLFEQHLYLVSRTIIYAVIKDCQLFVCSFDSYKGNNLENQVCVNWNLDCNLKCISGGEGRDRMVVGFTYLCSQYTKILMLCVRFSSMQIEVYSIQPYVI